MAQPVGLTLANSEPQSLHLQIRGPNACAAPPPPLGEAREGCQGPIHCPLSGHPRVRLR